MPGEPDVAPAPAPTPVAAPPTESGNAAAWWAQLLERLPLDGMVANLAQHAVLRSRDGANWLLRMAPGNEVMASPERVQALGNAISEYLGKAVRLQVEFSDGDDMTPAQREAQRRQQALDRARQRIRDDATIQSLLSTFDARLDEDSIQANEQE